MENHVVNYNEFNKITEKNLNRNEEDINERFNMKVGKDSVLHFENEVQKALWEVELAGQISDGKWENTKPFNHWIFWGNVQTVVDGKLGVEINGIGPEKSNYNFNSRELLEIVGDRMVAFANAATKGYTTQEIAAINILLEDAAEANDFEGFLSTFNRWMKNDHAQDNMKKHLPKMFNEFKKNPEEVAKQIYEVATEGPYDMKKLKKELKKMKEALKNRL